jgi:A/G-specific adenine glycosylase
MRTVSVLKIHVTQAFRFRRRLLAWFALRKRDLPWRRSRDPYIIWISEIMLQQTRVAAVIPYFEKFVAKFPTVQSLARARSETVLGRWAGLGYYSRARNLHRAAKEIAARHSGFFPRGHDATLALPGVGRYTAAAVLSIAYGQPLAVLDGNVARVLARLAAVRGDLRTPAMWRELEATAQVLLDRKAPGDWNQAMMELGATVCTPKSPRCGECPVASWCVARKLGIAEQLPLPRKKRTTERITLAAAVLLDPQGRTLLVRQTASDGALFSRMWQFPALEFTSDPASDLGLNLARYLRKNFKIAANGNMVPLKAARHTVTYRNIRLVPFVIRLARLPQVEGSRTIALGGIRNVPVSNATRKIVDAALGDVAKQ